MHKLEFPTLYGSKIQSCSQGLLDESFTRPHTTLNVILPQPRVGCFWPTGIPYPKGLN